MPFTLAHPAAVIPLARIDRGRLVPSALAIGSVAPDLAYYLPLGVTRTESHSLAGLLWFCLPVGFATYVLFHLILERPMASLLPARVAGRLASLLCVPGRLPAVEWRWVGASLLLGALSHLGWDAFTHEDGLAVRAIGFLRTPVLSVGAFQIVLYKVLQHGSTVLGILFLTWWVKGWLSRAAPQPMETTPAFAPSTRARIVIAMFTISTCVGAATGFIALPRPVTASALQHAVGTAVVSTISTLWVIVLVFSIHWHLRARPSDGAP